MKNGIFKNIGMFMIFIASNYAIANESYNPNPFTPPPAAVNNSSETIQVQNRTAPNPNMPNGQRPNRNQVSGQTNNLNTVTKALTEKEIRTNKILEAINGKQAFAKNIPIENSRYVGVINGKRIYQDMETNEYVKIDIENN